jgi:Na+-driven multidrug efflux pump
MFSVFFALIALGIAAATGVAVAATRASSPRDGVARQVTLGILAVLLLAVTLGCGFLLWFLWDFSRNFTF